MSRAWMMARGGGYLSSSRSCKVQKPRCYLWQECSCCEKIESLNEFTQILSPRIPSPSSSTYRARSRTRFPLSSNGPSPSPYPTLPTHPVDDTSEKPTSHHHHHHHPPPLHPPQPRPQPFTSHHRTIPPSNSSRLVLKPCNHPHHDPKQTLTTPPTASTSTLISHPCQIPREHPRRGRNSISTVQPLGQILPSQPPLTRVKDRKRTHTERVRCDATLNTSSRRVPVSAIFHFWQSTLL